MPYSFIRYGISGSGNGLCQAITYTSADLLSNEPSRKN